MDYFLQSDKMSVMNHQQDILLVSINNQKPYQNNFSTKQKNNKPWHYSSVQKTPTLPPTSNPTNPTPPNSTLSSNQNPK
jgi:hypothetical protein